MSVCLKTRVVNLKQMDVGPSRSFLLSWNALIAHCVSLNVHSIQCSSSCAFLRTDAICCQSKDELMIEELIAEELELEALSKRQAVTEEQQSQRQRQKQRDELIDDLVSLLVSYILVFYFVHKGNTTSNVLTG